MNKIINNFLELKENGTIEVKTNNLKKKVIVCKKFDQYTGKVVGEFIINVDIDVINKRIDELKTELDSLRELKKDLQK